MSKNVLALICLIMGVSAGYLIGKMNASHRNAGGAESSGNKYEGGTTPLFGDRASLTGNGDKFAAMAGSLDGLMSDFSLKRADQLVDGLSVDQIKASLQYLRGKQFQTFGATNHQIISKLYVAWAKINSDEAWEAARSEEKMLFQVTGLGGVAGEIVKKDPDQAIEKVTSLGVGNLRIGVVNQMMNEWFKSNPEETVDFLSKEHELPIQNFSLYLPFSELAKENPIKFADLTARIKNDSLRQGALSGLMQQWKTHDPEGALQWIQNLDDQQFKDTAITAWSQVQSGKEQDPLDTIKVVESIKNSDQRRNAINNVVSNWIQRDPQGALKYLANEGQDLLKNVPYAFSNVIMNATFAETEELLNTLPEGEIKQNVIASVTSSVIYNGKYVQAISLLNQSPDSSQRDYQLHELGKQWAKKEPKQVEAWLIEQEDSSDRDLAIAGFAQSIVYNDPDKAIHWVNQIPDEDIKNSAYKNVIDRWLRTDEVSAKQWLEKTNMIDAKEKTRILDIYSKNTHEVNFVPNVKNRR